MRILFYLKAGDKPDVSLGVHIREVLNGLSGLGHTVFYAGGQTFVAGQKTSAISGTARRAKPRTILETIRAVLKAIRLYKVFLLFSAWFDEIVLFFTALRTVRRRKPDLIYRRHSPFNFEYLLAWLCGLPYVKEVNSLFGDEARNSKQHSKFWVWITDKLERISLSHADRYIVVTPKLKEILNREYNIPANKIVVIENGANTELFSPLEVALAKNRLKLEAKVRYICFSGALVNWQGIEYLLETLPLVLKDHPDASVLIVGEGELKDSLVALSRRLGIENKVIFTGKAPYEEVPLYISASEICAVPKKPLRIGYSPLKLCEYLACSRPVVATRTDGFELLEEYNAGILVDPQNSEEFARALNNLLDDPELRKKMGENGRKYVVANRSWASVAARVARGLRRSNSGIGAEKERVKGYFRERYHLSTLSSITGQSFIRVQ